MGGGEVNEQVGVSDQTAIPIQDGREINKAQNGLGVGAPGDPAYTLDTLGAQAVMVSTPYVKVIRPASDQHPEVWREEQTAPTLNAFDNGGESRATVLAVSENQRGEVVLTDHMHALATGGGKPSTGYPAVLEPAQVRRLTPLECERLMGWPDDHTRWRADGSEQSDSARYRQCGNGVASPVAAWVGKHLLAATVEAGI